MNMFEKNKRFRFILNSFVVKTDENNCERRVNFVQYLPTVGNNSTRNRSLYNSEILVENYVMNHLVTDIFTKFSVFNKKLKLSKNSDISNISKVQYLA